MRWGWALLGGWAGRQGAGSCKGGGGGRRKRHVRQRHVLYSRLTCSIASILLRLAAARTPKGGPGGTAGERGVLERLVCSEGSEASQKAIARVPRQAGLTLPARIGQGLQHPS